MSSNSAFIRGEGTCAYVRRWIAELSAFPRSTQLFHHKASWRSSMKTTAAADPELPEARPDFAVVAAAVPATTAREFLPLAHSADLEIDLPDQAEALLAAAPAYWEFLRPQSP